MELLGLVVHQQAGGLVRHPRTTGYDDDRRFFRVRRGNGIDHVERPGPVGNRRYRGFGMKARRGIGGKPHCRLMAQSIQRQDAAFFDYLEQW